MTDLQRMLIAQEGTGPVVGERFFPYRDTVDKITIGYGHNLNAKGLSKAIVDMLFAEDTADAIIDARAVCSLYDQLTRPRQLALVSMAFNLGRERLVKFTRFLEAVHAGDWDKAADEILDSDAARKDPHRYNPLAYMMRANLSQWV